MSQVHQAREAFGARLRELRTDAGLTGRDLARAAGWPESKVSRFEHGRRTPSESDVRAWCEHTGADDQLADLLEARRDLEVMWVEYRRMLRAGLRHGQQLWANLEEVTGHLRWYEQFIVPGLLQTAQYAHAALTLAQQALQIPDDVDEAVRARMDRQRVLYAGDRQFAFLIEQQVLATRLGGDADVLAGQLDRLLAVMSLPRISLGIIPADAVRHVLPDHSFVIFGDAMVRAETVSAELTVSQPHEIALYEQTFALLQRSAVYGAEARGLLAAALTAP